MKWKEIDYSNPPTGDCLFFNKNLPSYGFIYGDLEQDKTGSYYVTNGSIQLNEPTHYFKPPPLCSSSITLNDFIGYFVEPNTMIRLWKKVKGGHELIEDVKMEHELIKSEYKDKLVVGVTDILNKQYCEAVNITIEI